MSEKSFQTLKWGLSVLAALATTVLVVILETSA